MPSYRESLPVLWACKQFDSMRDGTGQVYGMGMFEEQIRIFKHQIDDDDYLPNKCIKRLIRSGTCSYCPEKITTSAMAQGDHSAGRKMDGIVWCVPCCIPCNSSKGNKDMFVWWVDFKKRNFTDLDKNVVSVFVRAMFRLMKKENRLDEQVPEAYNTAMQQIKNHWRVVV